MDMIEQHITCPYCWESIGLLLDLSLPEQEYIEDCSVCCHPIQVSYATADGMLTSLAGRRSDD